MFKIDDFIFYPSPFDRGRFARFFLNKELNQSETELKKQPVYREKVMCEIRTTGSTDVFKCPVRAQDIQDFPEAWKAYQGEAVNVPAGTAIENVEGIDSMQAIYYLSKGIRTAEQLAEISDGAIASYGSGSWIHRDKARKLIGWKADDLHKQHDKEMQEMRERMKLLESALAEKNAQKEIARLDAEESAQPVKRRARRKSVSRVTRNNDASQHSAANL